MSGVTCMTSPVSWRSSYCGSTRNPIAPMGPSTCPNCLAAFHADAAATEAPEAGTR